MADQTLHTLHPFLQVNRTPTSRGCTVQSYSHDHGSGPILVLVHGWPQSAYMWRHVVQPWSARFSLFIPELPGYGFSSPAPAQDKRTVGRILVEALHTVFPAAAGTSGASVAYPPRDVIWVGHDRGGRVGHRLLVDTHPSIIRAAVLIDIVPTTEQWAAFARPGAAVAYHHWPFLALPHAPRLIRAMGPGVYVADALERARGRDEGGVARFREDGAVEHYVAQFSRDETVEGSCKDYAAGAFEDVALQEEDQREGRKIFVPTMVIFSTTNLGRMHDVHRVWPGWVMKDSELRVEGIEGGYGHYLPEECPEKVTKLVFEWVDHVLEDPAGKLASSKV